MGRIEFVNCFPLYCHFEEELAGLGYEAEIIEGTPAELNSLLARGEIDIALPSSIEFARHADRWALLPGISISSFGAVDSIQLFTQIPRAQLESIALTEKSATSVCLLKVLCGEWGLEPSYAPRQGPLAQALANFAGLDAHNSVEIGLVVGGASKRFHANRPLFQHAGVTGERLFHHEAEKLLAALARAEFRAG